MEFAVVEKSHAKVALCRGGRLHAFIHEPKGSVSVELVLEPNSCDPVPPGAPEKRKECLPHPLGQFEIGSIEQKATSSQLLAAPFHPHVFRYSSSNLTCNRLSAA